MNDPLHEGIAGFLEDTDGAVPLKIAPMLILGLSLLVLVVMYLTTV